MNHGKKSIRESSEILAHGNCYRDTDRIINFVSICSIVSGVGSPPCSEIIAPDQPEEANFRSVGAFQPVKINIELNAHVRTPTYEH